MAESMKPMFTNLIDSWTNCRRGFRAEVCNDESCPAYHETMVDGFTRIHPVNTEAFQRWRESGGKNADIPSEYAVSW